MVGQVVAVASGKGGVGKTTTVVNLGVVLRRAEHSVALVDADLGMANLGPMLGIDGELTLHDVLAGGATLEEALVEEAPGFAVLAGSGSLTDYPTADPRNLGAVLDTLAESYDFVIVDTGAGMSHEDVLPLGLADRVVLVTSPDPAAIGDTRKTAELAGLAEGDIAGLVVTKADPDTDAAEVADRIGVNLLGVIPYDGTVRQSTAAGRPLEAVDPETPAAAAYRELAAGLADGAADPLGRDRGAEPEPTGASDGPGAAGTEAAEPDEGADGTLSVEAEPSSEPAGGEAADAAKANEAGTGDADTPGADDAAAPEPPEVDPGPGDDSVPAEDPPTTDAAADEGAGPGEAEPAAADDEAGAPDGEADAGDAAEGAEDAEPDEPEEEDPLAEFEDDEPASKGGLFARIGRLFR